ncbi:predicted protein [Histoplasma capsulatum H143]|uniref:Uncharacterized protein n=1 Tax=Ajellomyces capsulatus (strain H143) TaxID=544712 RepID=C6HN47_AJECH|nr:predicted protein [Histoplasma capsulatum H143]
MGPFFTLIPFPESPEIPNNMEGISNEPVSKTSTDGNGGVFDRFALPHEIIQVIYRHLNSYQDVVNLKKVARIGPDARKWFILSSMIISRAMRMEWSSSHSVELAISVDAFKVHAIAYIFVDKHLGDVKAISVFIDVWTQSIMGFEFIFGSSLINIGCPHLSVTKVSFHVDFQVGEVFTVLVCAEANVNSGVAMKFFTNFGRSVIFGDPTAENWCVAVFPKGVFCISRISPSVSIGIGMDCISVLGVLQSRSLQQHIDVNTSQSAMWYETVNIKFTGSCELTVAFLSMVDFTAVSRITIYMECLSGNGYLCGIKIFHRDSSPDMLGEA